MVECIGKRLLQKNPRRKRHGFIVKSLIVIRKASLLKVIQKAIYKICIYKKYRYLSPGDITFYASHQYRVIPIRILMLMQQLY